MAFLSRDGLLLKSKVVVKKVEFDDGEFVFVKQMSGKERDAFEGLIITRNTTEDGKVTYERVLESFRARLAVCTVCDELGHLLLTADDVDLLNENMSAARLQDIADAAQELNKITPEKKADATKK